VTTEPHADPRIEGAVLTEHEADPHWLMELRTMSARQEQRIPSHYIGAVVTVPEVAEWVRALVDIVRDERRTVPRILTGPSLLLLGKTGTGKTFQAYGAIRALAASGAGCSWLATTAADMYGTLRPRPRVDSEEEFNRYARAGLLVLDDLGAAKGSEWNEEINYRLINHRYENELPTLITSNVEPAKLAGALGERVASRLVEMAQRVVIRGADRRLNAAPTPLRGAS
jgi:DNA replication protein DnaC